MLRITCNLFANFSVSCYLSFPYKPRLHCSCGYSLHCPMTVVHFHFIYVASSSYCCPHVYLSVCVNAFLWDRWHRDGQSVTVSQNMLPLDKGSPYSVAENRVPELIPVFFAVSLQVTWVINPAVGCHYLPPGLQLPSQPLRGLLPISLLGEQRHDRSEQFA